jgi:prepilin-type N-terminal cleavage/methylation domain-containing protein
MAKSQKAQASMIAGKQGFSMAELLVVIAVLGILAAIGVPVISGMIPGSETAVAQRNLNLLNGALHNFKQSYWEISTAASSGSDDERDIFRSLQFRDPVDPFPGTPFLPATAKFEATSSTETYRAYWNGMVFRMYPKNAVGTGLDLLKMSETTTAYASTTNGPPVGPP